MRTVRVAWTKTLRRWLREPRILWRSEIEARQTWIEVRSWFPFGAAAAALVGCLFFPNPVMWMSAAALVGLCACAYAWMRAAATGIHGERKLRYAAMQVGDELEEEIRLVNQTWLPVLWAEFQDRSNFPGYQVSGVHAAEGRHTATWRVRTICARRGVFRLGPWELKLGDPFGVLTLHQVYQQPQEILVYPPLAVLPEQLLRHQGAFGDRQTIHQPVAADTLDSATVRSYQPGDPLHKIHWRSTARHDAPYVKVFSPQAASDLWIVPDFDLSGHHGSGNRSSLETMVTVAASLAAMLLQRGLAVGLLAAADDEVVALPRQGQAYLWTLLQALAPLEGVHGRPLQDVLERSRSVIAAHDLMILITPAVQGEWAAALRRWARRPGQPARIEVILLDPASFDETIAPSSDPELQGLLQLLREENIPAHCLRYEDVQWISGSYGELSRWEFTVSGTGRAVARRSPREAGTGRETERRVW